MHRSVINGLGYSVDLHVVSVSQLITTPPHIYNQWMLPLQGTNFSEQLRTYKVRLMETKVKNTFSK